MNWLQILNTIAQSLPAVEGLSLETIQVIVAISKAASAAPAEQQAAMATAIAKLPKTA